MHLSQQQAVNLSAELGGVAVELAALVVKYHLQNIFGAAPWYRRAEQLLSVLEPFAHDPEVAETARCSGLVLFHTRISDISLETRQLSGDHQASLASNLSSELATARLGNLGDCRAHVSDFDALVRATAAGFSNSDRPCADPSSSKRASAGTATSYGLAVAYEEGVYESRARSSMTSISLDTSGDVKARLSASRSSSTVTTLSPTPSDKCCSAEERGASEESSLCATRSSSKATTLSPTASDDCCSGEEGRCLPQPCELKALELHGKLQSSTPTECKLRVTPILRPGRQTFMVMRRPNSKVLDLRRELSRKMGMTLGRMWLAERPEAGKSALLDDWEPADKAARLIVSNQVLWSGARPASRPRILSRNRALALLHEFSSRLDAIEPSGSGPIPQEAARSLQDSLLPKYGYSSRVAMLSALDEHMGDEDVGREWDTINAKLGQPMQVYAFIVD